MYAKLCKINAHNQFSLETKLSCYLQSCLISLLVLINPFKENNRCDYIHPPFINYITTNITTIDKRWMNKMENLRIINPVSFLKISLNLLREI